jgi:hypothetical protein
LAFSTAALNAAFVAKATFAYTAPVEGLSTSAKRPLVPATSFPPIK